jgi:hypothetical protein
MEGKPFTTSSGPERDPRTAGIDEQPPLNIKETAELGQRADAAGITIEALLKIRTEERLQLLKEMRDRGELEADTEEMKIIAESDSPARTESPKKPLTPLQKRAAQRLAEHEAKQRKEARVRAAIKRYGGSA